jgi:Fe-S-cluster containining protein
MVASAMECRPGCGACCIAPSIHEPFPGMPDGKPAGVACVHLQDDARCGLWGHPDRPRTCADFRAEPDICGSNRSDALRLIGELERATQP